MVLGFKLAIDMTLFSNRFQFKLEFYIPIAKLIASFGKWIADQVKKLISAVKNSKKKNKKKASLSAAAEVGRCRLTSG